MNSVLEHNSFDFDDLSQKDDIEIIECIHINLKQGNTDFAESVLLETYDKFDEDKFENIFNLFLKYCLFNAFKIVRDLDLDKKYIDKLFDECVDKNRPDIATQVLSLLYKKRDLAEFKIKCDKLFENFKDTKNNIILLVMMQNINKRIDKVLNTEEKQSLEEMFSKEQYEELYNILVKNKDYFDAELILKEGIKYRKISREYLKDKR